VEENLELGAYSRAATLSGREMKKEIDLVIERFPALNARRKQPAGSLSGGEQQMVAIGRGLMAAPRLLLLDEPSLGLAPLVVREIFGIIRELQREGCTVLLVEQNAKSALAVSDRAYVMENGSITSGGPAEMMTEDETIRRAFLGQDVGK
jgi:branched-chain amino acid transport system ATP-binding protein